MQKSHKLMKILLAAALFSLTACVGETENNGNNNNNNNNNPSANAPDNVQTSNTDIADCVLGFQCENSFSLPDVKAASSYDFNGTTEGFYGEIDNDCHVFYDDDEKEFYLPDTDYFGIAVPARTPVLITVHPTESSKLVTDLTIYNSAGKDLLFNSVDDSKTAAQARLFAPSTDMFYAGIKESKNYSLDYVETCSGSFPGGVGGSDYGYVITVEEIPNGITSVVHQTDDSSELVPKGETIKYTGKLSLPGDTQYHHITVPSDAIVTVSVSAASGFTPRLSGMNNQNGNMIWVRTGNALNPNSAMTLNSEKGDFKPETIKAGAKENMKYSFAVFDYNGVGASNYEYTLTIKVN